MIGVPPRALQGVGSAVEVTRTGEAAVARQRSSRDVAVSTGERVARHFFELCENPRTRDRVMRAVRAGATSAVGGRLLVALLSRTVLTPLLRSRRVDLTATRLELVAAQLGGVAVLRYVTRMEPVASMPLDDLVRLVGPALQATLEAAPEPVSDPSGADEGGAG